MFFGFCVFVFFLCFVGYLLCYSIFSKYLVLRVWHSTRAICYLWAGVSAGRMDTDVNDSNLACYRNRRCGFIDIIPFL